VLSLKRYWEDIEEVTETCDRQTDAEKMKIAFQYIDQNDELLWKGVLPGDGNQMTWASFKKEVEKLYPGSDGSMIFSSNDLNAFISTGVSKRITSKDDFAEYCRKFQTIMDHLVREGQMSELESKKMFPKGLHEDFQVSIICQMEILKLAHPSGMPRGIEDMIEAGQCILDALESEVGKSADTVFIKKEMV
jgi:polyhydroxyalkanoate synthesis regulator phasin